MVCGARARKEYATEVQFLLALAVNITTVKDALISISKGV